MNIQKIPISQINPAPYNPRLDLQPGDPEYQKLKQSIETFGYVDPAIWNQRTGNLVGGHQRLKILVAQGLTEIDDSVVDLPLEKEKAFNLVLNKISGGWDEAKLATLLEEIRGFPDIDVSLTGFDLPEINQIFDRQMMIGEDDYNFDAEVNAAEAPVTQPGDVIDLGVHRVMCADATVSENYALLFGGAQADLLWTDLPYSVAYTASRPGAPANGRWRRIEGDDLPQEQYDALMRSIFKNAASFIKDGAPVYVWNGHRQFWTMSQMLIELGFYPACVITWAKPGFSPSYADYQQQTEFCLYGWKEGAAHPWYGSAESSLWEVNRDAASSLIHPTQKPVALAQHAIRNSSRRGEIILDVCLGSGSALIAAERLGRRCFGFEIDPAYCDAIVRRYIAHVGKDKVSEEILTKYSKEM